MSLLINSQIGDPPEAVTTPLLQALRKKVRPMLNGLFIFQINSQVKVTCVNLFKALNNKGRYRYAAKCVNLELSIRSSPVNAAPC